VPGRPPKLNGTQLRRLYTLIAGTDPRQLPSLRRRHVGARPHPPVGSAFGDLLVRPGSASAAGHPRAPFEDDHGTQVGGVAHVDLLNHPVVYDDQLVAWLTGASLTD